MNLKEWVCNECNFPNFTQAVSEEEIEAEMYSCINCGCFEFHLVPFSNRGVNKMLYHEHLHEVTPKSNLMDSEWWNLQIEQLQSLSESIKIRINQLEQNKQI
jgi:hypothetical protein